MSRIHNNKRRSHIALEGTRLIKEALHLGIKLEYLFVVKNMRGIIDDFRHLIGDAEIHNISEQLFMTWSSVTTPPGVIGMTFLQYIMNNQNVDVEMKCVYHNVTILFA